MQRWISIGGAAVVGLALLVPAPAAADAAVRLRLGQFTPDGESRYWEENEVDFTGSADDFEGLFGGADFLWDVHPFMGVMISVDHSSEDVDQEYRDFEEAGGFPIVHTTTLEITPLTVGLLFHLAPERSPIRPYVGVGGGFYVWRLEEDGDFIDFTEVPPEIFRDRFEDEGTPLGYYVLAGLEVPLSHYISVIVEGRLDQADDDLEGDFAGLGDLDLSGRRIGAGISWTF